MSADAVARGLGGQALTLGAQAQAAIAALVGRIAQPRLVAVPFSALDHIDLFGAASAAINGNFPENDDGTQSGLDIAIPASATYANSVQVRRVINGNAIGVRLSRRQGGTYNAATPFGLFVDGQPFEIDWSSQVYPEAQTGATLAGAVRTILLGTDFGPGAHDVRLAVPGDASVARTLGLVGWLADEAAGYRAPVRGVSLQDQQLTLTGTGKAFVGLVAGSRGLVGFYYGNVSGASATLDLFAANSGIAQRLQRLTVAAGADGYCALPGIVPDGIQLQASAANAFIVTPVGAM